MPHLKAGLGSAPLPSHNSLSFHGSNVKATEIGRYDMNIPMEVAKAAVKDDGLDQIFFEAEDGQRYVAYADGMDFKGLKHDSVPASLFDGNTPMDVQGEFQGKTQTLRILHIDNETNTYAEGAKMLAIPTALTQALPNAFSVAVAPASARAASQGTNLMAKVTRWVGGTVVKIGQKTRLGVPGVTIAVGALTMAAGVGGGAVYYGKMRGQEYDPVKGLMLKTPPSNEVQPIGLPPTQKPQP